MVLLHGLFGSNDNLGGLARALAETHTVHALDLRNHGRSPHAETMHLPTLAADVRETMAAHHLDAAAFLGHSLGGKVAMELALTEPERVDRLVVIDMAPIAYGRGHDTKLEAMRGLDLTALASRRDADAALASGVPSSAIRQFLLKNLVRGEDGFTWRIPLDTISEQYAHFAAAPSVGVYEGPTLFLRGAGSSYLTDDTVPTIRERFPQARIETIEDAGHWVHIEAPNASAKVIVTFLDRSRTTDEHG
ncbi:MAG: alpha/beta fold hydrolase [Halofilum sp. (in: g-proteobacteria)]